MGSMPKITVTLINGQRIEFEPDEVINLVYRALRQEPETEGGIHQAIALAKSERELKAGPGA